MDNIKEKLKYINKAIDSIYADTVMNDSQRAELEGMLSASVGTRFVLALFEGIFTLAFVAVCLIAFIKGKNNQALQMILIYGLPCLAVMLIFNALRYKYKRASEKLELINKRRVVLADALALFKADRETLIDEGIFTAHAYTPLTALPADKGNKDIILPVLVIVITAIWAGNGIKYVNENRVETERGISSVVLNDDSIGENEAGVASNAPTVAEDEDGEKEITLPGGYSQAALNGDVKRLEYTWTYNFAKWTQTMEISQKSYEYYKNRRRTMNGTDYTTYIEDESDDAFIKDIADGMCKNGEENGYDDFGQLELMVSFVQSLDYIEDKDENGNDIEYPKYPIETLYDKGGDCEDTCILLASLIRARGYGVALLKLPEHVAVGIKGSPESGMGSYYELNGNRYYYVETTSENWAIGEIPDEYKGKDAEVIVIN